ncbi:MAG: hypothetical protein IPN69_23325 [Acidobacteria bacterium]|nr:hypothetical protein [Acidobacteriota bacterium]
MSTEFRIVVLTICFTTLAALSGCAYFEQLRADREKAQVDVLRICERLPIPDEFVFKKKLDSVDIAKVAYFRDYQSSRPCSEVGAPFREHLLAQGWDPNEMSVRDAGGGLVVTSFEFRKGEYKVVVECEKNPQFTVRSVVVSCSRGLP